MFLALVHRFELLTSVSYTIHATAIRFLAVLYLKEPVRFYFGVYLLTTTTFATEQEMPRRNVKPGGKQREYVERLFG